MLLRAARATKRPSLRGTEIVVAFPPEGDNARAPTFCKNGRAEEGGCHAARVLVRAPGDEIGDEERQRNLERDQQRERAEQDRGRLPDGQLARVGARRGQPPEAKREQRVREDAWRLRRLEQVAGRGPGGADERPAAGRTRRSTYGAFGVLARRLGI